MKRQETHKILVVVNLEFDDQDKVSDAEVNIATEGEVPFAAAMVAAENLMTMVALDSPAGFDKALDLLVSGATPWTANRKNGISFPSGTMSIDIDEIAPGAVVHRALLDTELLYVYPMLFGNFRLMRSNAMGVIDSW